METILMSKNERKLGIVLSLRMHATIAAFALFLFVETIFCLARREVREG